MPEPINVTHAGCVCCGHQPPPKSVGHVATTSRYRRQPNRSAVPHLYQICQHLSHVATAMVPAHPAKRRRVAHPASARLEPKAVLPQLQVQSDPVRSKRSHRESIDSKSEDQKPTNPVRMFPARWSGLHLRERSSPTPGKPDIEESTRDPPATATKISEETLATLTSSSVQTRARMPEQHRCHCLRQNPLDPTEAETNKTRHERRQQNNPKTPRRLLRQLKHQHHRSDTRIQTVRAGPLIRPNNLFPGQPNGPRRDYQTSPKTNHPAEEPVIESSFITAVAQILPKQNSNSHCKSDEPKVPVSASLATPPEIEPKPHSEQHHLDTAIPKKHPSLAQPVTHNRSHA